MKLHQRIQVTAELVGRPMSDLAVVALTKRLEQWPEPAVAHALDRCAAECRGALTFADVLRRLPGSAPLADEAWAIASQAYDEDASVVWTDAMATAFGEVRHMRDRVAARMAFKANYEREVAKQPPGPVSWWPSMGHDVGKRVCAIDDAIAAGRLSEGSRDRLLGRGRPEPRALPSGTNERRGPVSLAEMHDFVATLKAGKP